MDVCKSFVLSILKISIESELRVKLFDLNRHNKFSRSDLILNTFYCVFRIPTVLK